MNTTGGVAGIFVGLCRAGEDDLAPSLPASVYRLPLDVMSWDELRMRAISSSARPCLFLGTKPSSDVGMTPPCLGRRADDSSDEK